MPPQLAKYLIGPPFSNLFHRSLLQDEQLEHILGSYTLYRRKGMIWHYLLSLRPTKEGWRNKIGLRNPGISRVEFYKKGIIEGHIWQPRDTKSIFSFAGLEADDWSNIAEYIPSHLRVELNVGCPNCHACGISPFDIKAFLNKCSLVVVKLPADERIYDIAEMAVKAGVQYLHTSNTIPGARGGESGGRLKRFNLPVIAKLHEMFPGIKIIGGGGIGTSANPLDDARDYENAGAEHIALSTIFLRRDYFLSLAKVKRALEI